MPVTDSQLEIIFRYFDGELSPDEEAQLMQQLQQNGDLQQAFDQQIMMRQFAPEQTALQPNPAVPEPAEVFLKKVSDTIERRQQPALVVALPNRKPGWQVAAAVATVCLLAALVYYLFTKPETTGSNLTKGRSKDSAATVEITPQQPEINFPNVPDTLQDDTALLNQLYADNRLVFHIDESSVPIPDEEYRLLYEQHRNKELAAKSENELIVKGQGDPEEEQLELGYLRLYKGLANMELDRSAEAKKLFNKLLEPGAGNKQLQYAARWNLLLLYLKEGNREKAVQMADLLAGEKSNTYYKQAIAIQTALHNRH